MRLLLTNDIHQMGDKWKNLVRACETEQPDVLCVSGDLAPKHEGIPAQLNSFPVHLRKYASKIKENCGAEIVFISGNDDNEHLVKDFKQGHKDKLWKFIDDKVLTIKGYQFLGMPWVPDHPFGYKYWCKKEYNDNLRINELQLCKPLILNKDNEYEEIENYANFLSERNSIFECLDELSLKVKDWRKTICLIHCPPTGCGLDHCASGDFAGSDAVTGWIGLHQPLITLHGHIHESPEYSGRWKANIVDSLCIQPGQMGFDLHYVMVELDGEDIVDVRHSIYGYEKAR